MTTTFKLAMAGILLMGLGLVRPAASAQDGPMGPAPATQQQPAPADEKTSASAPQGNGAASGPATPGPAAPATAPDATGGPTAPATKQIMVPSGTHIPLVLHNAISTKSARPGDPVYFETLYPIMIDGQVVIPAGSYVSGEVTESKRPGRVKGRGELAIKMTNMILPNAYQVNLNATPAGVGSGGGESTNSEGVIVGDSDKKDDAATVAKTTAAGAGIGAIAARSAGGAGIGAAAGAAVGLAAILLTRGPDAELPRGSTVEAVINRPLYLDAEKAKFATPGQASALPGPANREPVRSTQPF